MTSTSILDSLRISMMNRASVTDVVGFGPVINVHHHQMYGFTKLMGTWPKDDTLLDSLGLKPKSICEQYCQAIRDHLEGKIDHKTMVGFMGAKNVL
jgi:hypothetical protein